MGEYWSIEACGWVQHTSVVVPAQVVPSDDDAAEAAVEELLTEHVGLAT